MIATRLSLTLAALAFSCYVTGGYSLMTSASQNSNRLFLTLSAGQASGSSSKCVFQNGPYTDSSGVLDISTDAGTKALVDLSYSDGQIKYVNTTGLSAGDPNSLLYISNRNTSNAGGISGIKYSPTTENDLGGSVNIALESNGEVLCTFTVRLSSFPAIAGTLANSKALSWNLQIASPYPGEPGRICNSTFKQDVGIGVGGEPSLSPAIRLLVPFGLTATINLGTLKAAVGFLKNDLPGSIIASPGQGQDTFTALTFSQVIGIFPSTCIIAYGEYDPATEAPPCQIPVQFVPVGNNETSSIPSPDPRGGAGRRLLAEGI